MSESRNNVIGGLVLIALGVIFLMDNIFNISFWRIISDYWPVILIVIGIGLIIKPNKEAESNETTFYQQNQNETTDEQE